MSRGPKRQPAEVALRKGNPGKRKRTALEAAAGGAEPLRDAQPSIPNPPSQLTKRGRHHWREVVAHLVARMQLRDGDLRALARYCNYLSDIEACRSALMTKGGEPRLTYRTTSTSGATIFKPRPELQIMKELETKVISIEREYGLTPSSRATVSTKLLEASSSGKPVPAARAAPAPQDTASPSAKPDIPPAPASPIGLLSGRTKH